MEYGLGQWQCAVTAASIRMSLNPCFNGIWSRTPQEKGQFGHYEIVLILVLMEYGLGPSGCSN